MSGLLKKLSVVRRTSHLHSAFRSYSSVVQRPAEPSIRQTNRNDPAFLGIQPIFDSTIRSKKFMVKTKDDEARTVETVEILSRLSSGVVSLPFANFNRIRERLLKNFNISIDDGFAILRSCSQLVDRSIEDRVRMVDEAIQALKILIGEPKRSHLIAFAQAYRRSGRQPMDDYSLFFQKFNCPLDIEIFEELMYWACQNNDSMSNAMKILDDIKTKSIKPSEKIYSALILGYAKQSVDAFEKVLHEMKEDGIFPTSLTHTELIKAYLRHKQDRKASELFENCDEFSTDQLYEIIRSGVHRRNEKIIVQALNRLPSPIRNAEAVAPELQNICIEAIYANDTRSSDDQIDPYQLIIRHLPKSEVEKPASYNYGKFLLKEMIAKNEPTSKIFDLCNELITSGRNERPFHLGCALALRFQSKKVSEFLKALKHIEPLRPHYFWPLFCQAKSDEEILNVIRLAKELETELDSDTYLNFVLPHMRTLIDPQQIFQLLKENVGTMKELETAYIAFLVNYGKLESALDWFKQSKSPVQDPMVLLSCFSKYFSSGRFDTKSAYLIAEMMKELQTKSDYNNNNSFDLAGQLCKPFSDLDISIMYKLIRAYDKADVKMSRNTANIILLKIQKNQPLYDSLEPIIRKLISDELFPCIHEQQPVQSKESDIEILENQLKELTANGFSAHGVLHRLFSKYVQLRRHNDALRIETMFDAADVPKSAVYLAQSIRLHTNLDNMEKAIKCWRRVQKEHTDFRLNDFILIDLASLLIKNDQYDEAIDVLKSIKTDGTEMTLSNVTHNVTGLLTAGREFGVRHRKNQNVASQLMQVLTEKKLFKNSNVNLGQIVREFLDKNDLRSAVAYHLKFAENYNETPQALALIIELLKILDSGDKPNVFQIRIDEATKYAQRIFDANANVHGSSRANVQLILALACNRNDKNLRKLMLKPNLKFDTDHLVDSLRYFSNEKKIDIVITYVRSVLGLKHKTLSETLLYEILLNGFVKDNDYESAIQFYDELVVQNNIVLPKALARKLASFLARNKQEIPKKLREIK